MKTLIKNTNILDFDRNSHSNYKSGIDIIIDGATILYLGISKEHNVSFDEIIDGSSYLTLTGFVNSHSHLAMTLFRGISDNTDIKTWLYRVIFPLERKLKGTDVYWGSKLALLESIKAGVCVVSDMYFELDYVIEALKESGLKGNISMGMASILTSKYGQRKKIENVIEYIKKYHNKEDEKIKMSFGPHAIYTCSPQFLKDIAVEAKKENVLIQFHLNESKKEVEDFKRRYKTLPVKFLNSIGFFDAKVLLFHMVWTEKEEMEILKEKNIGIVTCPESNLKLGSGIAPLKDFLKTKINVSLGTDGAASNNNLDILEELHILALLHKGINLDPKAIDPIILYYIATKNGSLNLGFKNTGELKEGNKADLIMLKIKEPYYYPLTNFLSHLLYTAKSTDIEYLFVNGKMLMKKREVLTLDEEEILNKVQAISSRLISGL